MKDQRGRPKENVEAPIKYTVGGKPDYKGETVTYKFDRNKHRSGTVRVDIDSPEKPIKPEIKKNQKYNDAPVVVVFQTSKRKNAKAKIKVFANKNIDDVLTNSQAGIPEKAVWLEVGVGSEFESIYKEKYKL